MEKIFSIAIRALFDVTMLVFLIACGAYLLDGTTAPAIHQTQWAKSVCMHGGSVTLTTTIGGNTNSFSCTPATLAPTP